MFVNIGYGTIVNANKIVSVMSTNSAPVKRMIATARKSGLLVDCTFGRLTRAVLISDSGHVILSANQPETIVNRVNIK